MGTSANRTARRAITQAVATIAMATGAVLLLDAPAHAAMSGPWIRAQHNGYTLCGSRTLGPDIAGPDGFYAWGRGSSYTRQGASCSSQQIQASVSAAAIIYGWTGSRFIQCDSGVYKEEVSIGVTTNQSRSGFGCRHLSTWYTTASWHGGWISGQQFPHGATYPLTTNPECHGTVACPPYP